MQIQHRLVCWFGCLPVLAGMARQVAAQQAFIIHGLVIQSQTSSRISGVTIRDVCSNDIAMSDELGGFSIKAAAGDTLQFGKPGFTVTKLAIINPGDLVVTLGAEIVLREVTVKDKSIAGEQKETVDGYREKGLYFDGSPPLSLFNPISGSPLTGLHELLGKDAANERRYIRFTRNEQQEAYIDKRFTNSLVEGITDLRAGELSAFMGGCRPKYDDIKTWSDYQLQLYIKTTFIKWQKDKSTRPAGR